MDGLDDGPDLLADDPSATTASSNNKNLRGETVDLNPASSDLMVDISDALSERDKVKFTVHTKTTLSVFQQQEFSVVRQHEEFIWLHDCFVENEDYGAFLIPPAPPRPDFDASREKLQKLGEGENTMTKEEFNKMKSELEAEYLATFKKTVAMHEVFLQRIAGHPTMRNDHNFRVFLEYNEDLNVRGKNKKEIVGGFFTKVTKSADELLLSGQKDIDEQFEQDKLFLVEYHKKISASTDLADKMTKTTKAMANSFINISFNLISLSSIENPALEKFIVKFSEILERARKSEGRVASDEDLKLSDTLRYYMRDSAAARDLLYRRARSLANYENANKNLDKARAKNKDVLAAENAQQSMCEKFETLSEVGKGELAEFRARRVQMFRKNLTELAELEIKHAKAKAALFQEAINGLKAVG